MKKSGLFLTMMLLFSVSSITLAKDNQAVYKFNDKSALYKCEVMWMIVDGQKIKPTNDNLKTMDIEIADLGDTLILKSKNYTSTFRYNSFIDSPEVGLGIDYIKNGRFVDIFNDGYMYTGDINGGIDGKFYCPMMNLNVKMTSKI